MILFPIFKRIASSEVTVNVVRFFRQSEITGFEPPPFPFRQSFNLGKESLLSDDTSLLSSEVPTALDCCTQVLMRTEAMGRVTAAAAAAAAIAAASSGSGGGCKKGGVQLLLSSWRQHRGVVQHVGGWFAAPTSRHHTVRC